MEKRLKGLSRKESVQSKVNIVNCITEVIKGFINDRDYNIDVGVLLEADKLEIDIKSIVGELRMDIARSYDVSKDKFLPSLCKISKIIKLEILDINSNEVKLKKIDFSNLEKATIKLDEEKIEKIKCIKLIFEKSSMEGLFSDFIYITSNLRLVRSSLAFNFKEAIKNKKLKIRVEDNVNATRYEIQAPKLKSKQINSKTRKDKTVIEIRKNKEKEKKISIFVNDVLYNFDINDRYVNWRKKPFRKDGYTFVDLIINIKFYIDDFNLNDTEFDKKLFSKVSNEIELLLDANKCAFENANVNINYEEDKKLLNSIMVKIGYKKYSNGTRDLIRAIKKAEDDGKKVLATLKPYL